MGIEACTTCVYNAHHLCLPREREQILMVEALEMQRIRDDLEKKIEQIQFDFFEAMVPVLGRLQVSPLYVHDILIPILRH
jgi:hypothetical protein